MFHTHCSHVQAAVWYSGFSQFQLCSALPIHLPLGLCHIFAVSALPGLIHINSTDHHGWWEHGVLWVLLPWASPESCLISGLHTHRKFFSPLIMSSVKKNLKQALKGIDLRPLIHRHFRRLECLSTISKIIARWVRRRGHREKVCKIFHNKMEKNQNSGIYSRHTLLGKMLHISLKLFHRQHFC